MIKHQTFFKTKTKKKKPKWKTAKFSNNTKTEICKRDKLCIFCNNPWTDCHHVFYSQETNYWEDRNEVDQWVLVCRKHHEEIHSCSMWEWKRQEAINYLQNYYK